MQDMRIGLCWGTLVQANLETLIELSARYGFPTLSISPTQYLASLEGGATATSLRRRVNDAGVRVAVIDAIMSGVPGLPEAAPPSDAATCLAMAETFEAPVVGLAHYNGKPAPFDAIAESIGAICRKAAGQGVSIAIEFIPGTEFPNLPSAVAMAQACGEPNCGVVLDTWHLARSGGTVADIAALPPGMILSYQLSDRTEPAEGAPYVPMSGRDLPGEGELPLWPITDAIRANNPTISAELEVFSEELKAMSADKAAQRAAAAVAAWRARRPD